jgi:hypothetical protein
MKGPLLTRLPGLTQAVPYFSTAFSGMMRKNWCASSPSK